MGDVPEVLPSRTEWSMDYATLQRVNYSLWVCRESRNSKNFESWFNELVHLYLESVSEIDRRDKKGKFDNDLEELKNKFRKFQDGFLNYQSLPPKVQMKNPFIINDNLFWEFFEFEKNIRRLLDKAGLLMRRNEGGYAI